MAMGRPSKLNEETLVSCREYLEGYRGLNEVVPTIAGLAVFLGVSRETLYNWQERAESIHNGLNSKTDGASVDGFYSDFFDIAKRLMAIQEKELVNQGLAKRTDSSITKMMLGKHGYSDSVRQDQTSSDGSMSPKESTTVIDASKLSDDVIKEILAAKDVK